VRNKERRAATPVAARTKCVGICAWRVDAKAADAPRDNAAVRVRGTYRANPAEPPRGCRGRKNRPLFPLRLIA